MQKALLYLSVSVSLLSVTSAVSAFTAPVLPGSEAFTNCTAQFNISSDELNAISTRMSVSDFTSSLQQLSRNDCSILYKSPSEVHNPPSVINLNLGTYSNGNSGVVAETSGATITYDNGWLQRNLQNLPDMMGVFAHELTHVYQTHDGPHGFIEGMADYDRFRQNLAMNYSSRHPGGNWDDGYATSAFFIDYLNQRFQGAATLINEHASGGWGIMPSMTGEDVGTLWNEYQNWLASGTPALPFQNAIPPSSGDSGGSGSGGSGSGDYSSGGGGGGCDHSTVSVTNSNGVPVTVASGSSSGASTQGSADLSTFEKSIWQEINLLRSNPAAYAQYLAGNADGAEAIGVLMNTAPMSTLTLSAGMSKASKDHSNLMAQSNTLSHQLSGEPDFGERLNKYGTWGNEIAENIEEGVQNSTSGARDVVILYLIDKDVPDRGHRKNLLNPDHKFTGVGCSGLFCTNDFAGSYQEK